MKFDPGSVTASFRLNGERIVLKPETESGGDVFVTEAGGLTARLTRKRHSDRLTEMRVDLTNTSGHRSGQITELYGLDAEFPCSGPLSWEGISGDTCRDSAFRPIRRDFSKPGWMCFEGTDGRPSLEESFPYFDLSDDEGSVVIAVGWTGNWRYILEKGADSFSLKIGVTDCDFYLEPNESARSASVLLYFGGEGTPLLETRQGFRRELRKYVSPPFAGMTPMALAAQSFDRYYGKRSDWMTEEGQLHYVEEAAKCRYLDTFWLDAGWFREGFPNGLGNYSFPSGFPNGLKPVSDKAHANGMRMLVWFEPERVLTGSDVWNQHRDWLLESGEPWMRDRGMYLFNLGNDEAREWMTQNLIRFIRDNGIDVYRQDFNMSPLAYWRMNDAPGRRGYLENRHVAGLYRMMDDLLAAIPGLVIDNCSSGGRRLDFEMNRRSVPMWRSDTGCFPRSDRYHTETFNQNQVIGLTRYLVWHASSSWDTKAVSMRSSATDGLGCEFPFLDPEMDFEEARKALAETASLRRYWRGDFTPLVDEAYLRRNGPVAEDRWVGWQLSLKDEGLALFFRRCACEEDSACFSLTAIEEDAVYRIVLSDEQRNKTERTVRGSELAHDFRVTSPEKMSSVLMLYRKAETV